MQISFTEKKNIYTDVCFLISSSAKKSYQKLSKTYSAIEPPTWSLLLAESCRSKNFKVGILDANAEQLDNVECLNKIRLLEPRLLCFVVYGQNVNAGTTNMVGAVQLANHIKLNKIQSPIIFVGSYIQALPIKTLEDEKSVDIVCTNEGVYTLHNLLRLENFNSEDLRNIKGIGYRENNTCKLTPPEKIVPQDRMDIDLPGYAWDLLPFKNKPMELTLSDAQQEALDAFRAGKNVFLTGPGGSGKSELIRRMAGGPPLRRHRREEERLLRRRRAAARR